jgi:hypothetical protein
MDLLLGTDSRDGAEGALPVGFAGKVNPTIPLATLLDLAERPGEIPGLAPSTRIPKQIHRIVTSS